MIFFLILLCILMRNFLSINRPCVRNTKRMSAISSMISGGKNLRDFAVSTENTLLDFLVAEENFASKDQFMPRQIYHAHFTPCKTEPVPNPYFVIASQDCAQTLGLSVESHVEERERFTNAFVGNEVLPGLEDSYCTVYGCHVYGSWFGQLGDGRAITLGEVEHNQNRYELQLKGAGRSPFSRGFDGKAVLRSCVREFLASESMHHLGVSTTRALSIVGTGEKVKRAWYVDATTANLSQGKYQGRMMRPSGGSFPPDRMNIEDGAVMCRVSKSFIRVAQIELFAQRGEIPELVRLADYACYREFPHLLRDPSLSSADVLTQLDQSLISRKTVPWPTGNPRRYVELFRCICRATAKLVTEWLRVGYVQGNMNSDNCLIGGRTLDYGPYGFLEKYDPFYQPFTSDMDGKFSFMRQPSAMAVNMITLASSFGTLLTAKCQEAGMNAADSAILQQEVEEIAKTGFPDMFHSDFCEMRRKKLGLKVFREEDNVLWKELDMLLYRAGVEGGGGVDYTIFFRELISVATSPDMNPADALGCVEVAFYEPEDSQVAIDTIGWMAWFEKYLSRLQTDSHDLNSRRAEMSKTNPKYILRNWMAILAYEAAALGDYSVLNELHELLTHPYDEQESMQDKWYTKAPAYARRMPGAAFLS